MTDVVRLTQQTYDGIAAAYDSRFAPTEALLAFRDAFRSRVSGPVADLGCGPGRHLAWFDDVVGMDLSEGMLALARQRGRVVRGDVRRPPFRDLAGIWSSAALLHVPRPEVPAALAAWRAALRHGGTLGLSTSRGSSEGWEDVPYDPARRRWFVAHEEAELLSLVREAGFTVDEVGHRTTHREWLTVLATASG